MFTFASCEQPASLEAIRQRTVALGFDACSDERTGRLLSWIAAARPGARVLDLGTGTGMSAAWLLMGMDATSSLISVDNEEGAQSIARETLAHDTRAKFVLADGGEYLSTAGAAVFDLIFADAWPGKFSHLNEALGLLNQNGIYVIDDLFPQPNWPDNHQPNVDRLVAELQHNSGLDCLRMDWSTGIMLVRKRW